MIVARYPTKAALKAAAKESKALLASGQPGKRLRYEETSGFGPELVPGKAVPFVGPGAYQRVFYGQVTVNADFCIVAVK